MIGRSVCHDFLKRKEVTLNSLNLPMKIGRGARRRGRRRLKIGFQNFRIFEFMFFGLLLLVRSLAQLLF